MRTIAAKYAPLPVNDKYKHCMVSAEGTKKCGSICAAAAGSYKELEDVVTPGSAEVDDLIADADGIDCAINCDEPIEDCCRRKGHNP